MTQTQGLRVEEGRTKLITLLHNGEDLVFLHLVYGPNPYTNVGAKIEQDGLAKPTMAETVSLVHGAFNSENTYSDEIKKLMKKNWLWGFTGTLYVPKGGAYVQDYPEIRNGMPYMDESELVKKLEANDPGVRFVPFGFKTKDMTLMQLAKNDYVIALAGEEGAEKLAEVADKYSRDKPYLWSFDSVDTLITKVSALGSFWLVDHGLYVFGNGNGDDGDGYAFGVQKTGEASRAEK